MTATAKASQTVRDQELMPHGFVESASVNSFVDFVSPNLKETVVNKEKDLNDFINTFICHMIFYAFFCISLVFHILIDLGFGTYVKNQFLQLIEITMNIATQKKPAFA